MSCSTRPLQSSDRSSPCTSILDIAFRFGRQSTAECICPTIRDDMLVASQKALALQVCNIIDFKIKPLSELFSLITGFMDQIFGTQLNDENYFQEESEKKQNINA